MNGISVTGYQKNFKLLTKKLFEENRYKYKKILYAAKVGEVKKGFVATRVYKANSNGTRVTFKCADAYKFDLYCKNLNEEYKSLYTSEN